MSVEASPAGRAILLFQADIGETNDMSLHQAGGTRYRVDEAETAGPGCVPGAVSGRVICDVPRDVTLLTALIRLGGGNDEATVTLGRRHVGRIVAHGGPGNDLINALVVRAGGKRSSLLGGRGNDDLGGSIAADNILGGPGDDFLIGERGNDMLEPGPGRDRVLAGDGDDRIALVDGWVDEVRCGDGRDTAWLDRMDQLRERHGCNKVRIVGTR